MQDVYDLTRGIIVKCELVCLPALGATFHRMKLDEPCVDINGLEHSAHWPLTTSRATNRETEPK